MKNCLLKKNPLLRSLFVALLWFGASSVGFADNQKVLQQEETNAVTIYHVTTTGTDANDGLTWASSFATIQQAINLAHANPVQCEVWVATGTYSPTICLADADGLQITDEYKSFTMYSGVNVYGGFAGNETTREIGVTGGRQVVANGAAWEFANPTILDGSSTSSYHVVWFGSNGFTDFTYSDITVKIPETLSERTIMDGFTITGGFANIDVRIEDETISKKKYVHTAGGGVALVGNGELHNCIMTENKARYGGAGVSMFNGAKVLNCLVSDNEAVGANFYSTGILGFGGFDYWRTDGAGIVSIGADTNLCVIEGSTILNNLGRANDNYPNAASATNDKVNNGGGVYLVYTTMINSVVSGNNIMKNPSPYAGNSAASCGGGAYLYKSAVMDNCEITDNGFSTDPQNGAGVFIADYGTGQTATSYDDLVMTNCYVHSNRAGGAIAIDAQYSTIINTTVANNLGGGVYGYGNCRRSQTVNCLIYNNQTGWGHSTSSDNKDNSLVNSTVVNNGTSISLGNAQNHSISNCIVWGNNSNPATIGTNATVTYSAFSFTPPTGAGNIQIDSDNATGPKFENPTTGYALNTAGWEAASWKLELNSDCIDKGDYDLVSSITTTDIDGNPRLQACSVDLGAYEASFGGPVVDFAVNAINFNDTLYICLDDEFEFTFVDLETGSGDYPLLVSWVFDNDPTHAYSGTDVSVTAAGQVLATGLLDGGQHHIQVVSVKDDNGCIYYLPEMMADIFVSPEYIVTQDGLTLTVTAENATFQWVDCDDNFAIIFGETNSVFVAPANGSYAVIVQQNSCTDRSDCFDVVNFNIVDDASMHMSIYPNPSTGRFVFETDQFSDVTLMNSIGMMVYSGSFEKGSHSLNLSHLGAGIYIMNVRCQNQTYRLMTVIQ